MAQFKKARSKFSSSAALRWFLACAVAVLTHGLPFAALAANAEAVSAAEAAEEEDLWDYLGARAFRITLATGVDFTTGDYGAETKSNVVNVPTSLKIELDPFILRLTVPFIWIDGDVIPVGGDPVPVPGPGGGRSGLGDIVLAASYVYYPTSEYLPLTELKAKVKFGTADEQEGLGTGENDYTLQLDISKGFGPVTPFVGGGYKFIGRPPGVDLRDKPFAFAGLTIRANKRFNFGLAYDWSQSSVESRPDVQEVSPFMTIKFGRHFAIDPYGVVGLSSSAADWGVGMQMRFIYDVDRVRYND